MCNRAVSGENVVIISNNCKNEKEGKTITSDIAEFITISAKTGHS
jgi:hypothetical protein